MEYDEATGLYINLTQDSNIDIKSIGVGEKLNISNDMILKFMIYKLYKDKIKMEQDSKFRLEMAESAAFIAQGDYANRLETCPKCNLFYHCEDKNFECSYFCDWCEASHCGKCGPIKECIMCKENFSPKCVTENKYKDCCGSGACKDNYIF